MEPTQHARGEGRGRAELLGQIWKGRWGLAASCVRVALAARCALQAPHFLLRSLKIRLKVTARLGLALEKKIKIGCDQQPNYGLLTKEKAVVGAFAEEQGNFTKETLGPGSNKSGRAGGRTVINLPSLKKKNFITGAAS